jgi:hypothetical protein
VDLESPSEASHKAGDGLPPAFAFLVVYEGYYLAAWNSSFNAITTIAPET